MCFSLFLAVQTEPSPPIWETGWFFGLAVLLLAAAFLLVYLNHSRRADVQRRELENKVADRTRELAALSEISAAVSHSLDLRETLNDALEKTLQVVDVESGGIYLLDERKGILKIFTQSGLEPEFLEKIDHLEVGEGFSGEVILSGQALIIGNIADDPRLTRSAAVEQGIKALAVVPLKSKGKVLGTLFAAAQGAREFRERDIRLLTSIGNQIGVAIDNARLHEETTMKLAQLTALQDTNRAMVSTLELDELLKLIIQQATTLLNADGGVLNLVDWDSMEDEVVACSGTLEGLNGQKSSLMHSLSGWATLNSQPVISNHLQDDPRTDPVAFELLSGIKVINAAVAPLKIKDRAFGTLLVMNKAGGEGHFEQGDLDLLVAFASQAAAAIENARLYADERRRAEQFKVILEIGQQLTLNLQIDEILQKLVNAIHDAFGYYHVGIGMVEGDEVVYRVGAGELWESGEFGFIPARLKIGKEGISGQVAATGKSYLASDVDADAHYVRMQGSSTRSELTVPIIIKSQVIGVLDAQSDRLKAFDQTDLVVLQSLAHQAGAAIENIRLYKQSQESAVIEERNRLARELHDAVTQTLFSASLLAEVLPTIWKNKPEEGEKLLQELRSMSRGALAEMRSLLLELRPAALIETPLEDLLRQLGEAAGAREEIPVSVIIEGKDEAKAQVGLPPDVHVALYRIAQEALNNIVKHARATQVTVRLCYSCREGLTSDDRHRLSVLLSINDNGCGFDPSKTAADRLGIGIMQERAEAIGASLMVESQAGEGSQVTVLWEPMQEQKI